MEIGRETTHKITILPLAGLLPLNTTILSSTIMFLKYVILVYILPVWYWQILAPLWSALKRKSVSWTKTGCLSAPVTTDVQTCSPSCVALMVTHTSVSAR